MAVPTLANMPNAVAADIGLILPSEVPAGFTAGHMAMFPCSTPANIHALREGVISALPVGYFTVANMPNAFISNLESPRQIRALSGQQLDAIAANGRVNLLSIEQIKGLEFGQLNSIPHAQRRLFFQQMRSEQITALVETLSLPDITTLISGMPVATLNAMIGALQPVQLAELFVAISDTQIPALLPPAGNLTAAKMAAVIDKHISKMSVAQAGALMDVTPRVLTPMQISGMTRNQIHGLATANQINAITDAAVIPALKPAQIPELTNPQIANLTTAAQVQALHPDDHVAKLRKDQLGWMVLNISHFLPAQIKALDPEKHIAALSIAQIGAWTATAQIQAIEPEQIKKLDIQHLNPATQIPNLLPKQIKAIDTTKLNHAIQLPGFTAAPPTQMHAFNPEQLSAMTPDQLNQFNANQIRALMPEQLSLLSQEHRDKIWSKLSENQKKHMGKAPTAEQVANAAKTRAEAGMIGAQANEAQHQTSRKDNQTAADINQQEARTAMINTDYINTLLNRNNPMAMAAFQGIADRPQPPSQEMVQNVTATVAEAMKGADPAAIGEAITAALLAVNRPYVEALSHQDNQLTAIIEDRASNRAHELAMRKEDRLDAQEARLGQERIATQAMKNTNLATVLGHMTAANTTQRFKVRADEHVVHDLLQQ